MAHALFDSPIGPLYAETSSLGLRRLEFAPGATVVEAPRPDTSIQDGRWLEQTLNQIGEYFDGTRKRFDLPLDLEGSEFRKRVWDAIAAIPHGETLTYAAVAAAAGSPGAYRAAGAACGANPAVIVVPCHRVVGSDRSLHGFGGGLDTKAWLLRHENSLSSLKVEPHLLQAELSLAGV